MSFLIIYFDLLFLTRVFSLSSDAFNTKGPNVDRHIVQGGYDPMLLKSTNDSADITHAFAVFAGCAKEQLFEQEVVQEAVQETQE